MQTEHGDKPALGLAHQIDRSIIGGEELDRAKDHAAGHTIPSHIGDDIGTMSLWCQSALPLRGRHPPIRGCHPTRSGATWQQPEDAVRRR